jgi:tetratricopeptide (TPR) repeat protein
MKSIFKKVYLSFFVTVILFAFLINKSFSQNFQIIDSLKNELSLAKSSIEKVNIMIELSKSYRNFKPEESFNFLIQALELSKETDNENGIGYSSYLLGEYYFNKREFPIAKSYFESAFISLKLSKAHRTLGYLNNAVGRLYLEEMKYDSAQVFFEKALSYLDTANNGEKELSTFINLGNLSFYKNNYNKAEEYYTKGLEISGQIGDKHGIAICLSNIGNVLAIRGDLVGALDNYIKASDSYKKINDNMGLADCLNNIGLVNLFLERYEKSISYFRESQELYKSLKYKIGIINCYINIGKANIRLLDYKNAEFNLLQALDLSKEVKDNYLILSSYVQLGNLYYFKMDYGKAKKSYHDALEVNKEYNDELTQLDCYESLVNIEIEFGNLSEAEKYALKALSLAKELDYKINIRDSYQNLSKVYEEMGNYSKALKLFKLFKIHNDSIFNEENRKQINELETKFQTQKKQQQIDLQESILAKQNAELEQSKLLRKSLVGGIAALLLMVLVISYAYVIKRNSNIKINKQKKKIEAQKEILREANIVLQQQALSAQMNPHFMFNSLNSVQSYILRNDRVKSSEYLARFSRLMRKVLDNSQESFITLNEEFEALNLYIEMELIRFKDSFNYNLSISEDIDLNKHEIPPLILQPFVDNAILHGLRNKTGDKSLKIEVLQKTDSICILIEDNGIGRAEAQKIKEKKMNGYKSHGSKITAKRIDLFKEFHNDKIEHSIIDLKSEEGEPLGTRVEIDLL